MVLFLPYTLNLTTPGPSFEIFIYIPEQKGWLEICHIRKNLIPPPLFQKYSRQLVRG
jgi:hypothetical protein